jgi:hypothetical protein
MHHRSLDSYECTLVGVLDKKWEPGAGLMMELAGRAEALAGTFSAQEVGNMLWVACVFSLLFDPGQGWRGHIRCSDLCPWDRWLRASMRPSCAARARS